MKQRRRLPARLGILLVLPLVLAASACDTRKEAARCLRELEQLPRDPATGYLKGVQPLDFGKGRRTGVLLLHGFGGTPQDFGELPYTLEHDGFRVWAPLLPGHGTTPRDLKPLTVDDFVAATEKAYARLRTECDKVAVVGFSMGGALATRLVRDTTQPRPDALVLASPYFGITYRWFHILPPETWIRLVGTKHDFVKWDKSVCTTGQRDFFVYEAMASEALLMLVDLGRDLRRNPPDAVPPHSLLIYSPGDPVASHHLMEKMARHWKLTESSRFTLNKEMHRIFNYCERDLAVRTVADFLKKHLGEAGKAAGR